MPKRILYVISTLDRCGPVNVLFGIIRHLDRDAFDPVILTLSPESASSRQQDFADLGVDIVTLGLSRLAYFLRGKRELESAITSLAPDIIHTHGFRADTGVAKLKHKTIHMCTIHNDMLDDYIYSFGMIVGKYMATMHQKALHMVSVPIAVADHLATRISKRIGTKIRAIKNGVDLLHYLPTSENNKHKLRQQYGVATAKNVYVYSGNLTEGKGVVELAKAFRAVASPENEVLIIVGGGDKKNELEALSHPCIRIEGKVADVLPYLQMSDSYVSFSATEGIPMAILEALGCGLVLILSDIAAHREIVDQNDEVGILLKDLNEASLAAAMRCMSKHIEDEKIGLRRMLAENRYSDVVMSASYQEVYRELGTGSLTPRV